MWLWLIFDNEQRRDHDADAAVFMQHGILYHYDSAFQ